MLQMELGGVDFPLDEEFAKHRHQYSQDKVRLFASAERLIRCIIACQAEKQDAVGLRRALELSRSLSARAWDISPFQMKQLPQIGIAAIRKLAIAGITCIDDLEAAEPSRIEMLLNKNPPFGSKIVASAQAFPRLRAGIKMTGKVGPRESSTPSVLINVGLETRTPSDHQIHGRVEFHEHSSASIVPKKTYLC